MASDIDIWKLERSIGRWNKLLKPRHLGLIRQMFEDREGNMWFADSEGQVARYEANTDSWTCYRLTDYLPAYASKPNNLLTPYGLNLIVNVTAIFEDRSGAVFFGTNRGLLIFMKDRENWTFCNVTDHQATAITTMFEDKTGRVWLGTEKDIVIIAP
jgi:ligand-binding sensor domain-containing protein